MSGSDVTTTYATPRITAVASIFLNIGPDSFRSFVSIKCDFVYQLPHNRHGLVYRAAYNFAETDSLDQIRRLASDHQHPAHSSAERGENRVGVHAVRVGGWIDRLVVEVRLDHKDRSRPVASIHGIDQNERVVS